MRRNAQLQQEKGIGAEKVLVTGCFALGAILLVSGYLATRLYFKLTPVYTETECGDQTATLDKFEWDQDSIKLRIHIEVACRNPNPYGIQILASTPGRVFMLAGHNELEVGDLSVVPGSTLAEQGDGKVRVLMDSTMKGSATDLLLPHLLSDKAIPILMELQFDVGIALSLGLANWRVSAPFKKACGLNMAGILYNQFLPADGSSRKNRLGPLVCAESFKGLVPHIPKVGDVRETPADGNMGFSAAQVAPEEVRLGELAKNVGLGSTIVCSYLFGLIFVVASSAMLLHPGGAGGVMVIVQDHREQLAKSRHGCLARAMAALSFLRPQESSWEDKAFARAEEGKPCTPKARAGPSVTLPLMGSPQELRRADSLQDMDLPAPPPYIPLRKHSASASKEGKAATPSREFSRERSQNEDDEVSMQAYNVEANWSVQANAPEAGGLRSRSASPQKRRRAAARAAAPEEREGCREGAVCELPSLPSRVGFRESSERELPAAHTRMTLLESIRNGDFADDSAATEKEELSSPTRRNRQRQPEKAAAAGRADLSPSPHEEAKLLPPQDGPGAEGKQPEPERPAAGSWMLGFMGRKKRHGGA